MENQHRKISGYRDLNEYEIDLMNRIKAKGSELLDLQIEVYQNAVRMQQAASLACDQPDATDEVEGNELRRILAAEPQRWAAIGKTDIQTGVMALVRAVAQPAGV